MICLICGKIYSRRLFCHSKYSQWFQPLGRNVFDQTHTRNVIYIAFPRLKPRAMFDNRCQISSLISPFGQNDKLYLNY